MNKKQIINTLRTNKEKLKDNFNILRVGLFGSYSTNTYSEDSDIDIVYELEEGKRMGLKDIYELELFFKTLFKIDKIDLVNSKYMNPIIGNEIEKTVIYV
jgi:predicted nucleotidyltransferase